MAVASSLLVALTLVSGAVTAGAATPGAAAPALIDPTDTPTATATPTPTPKPVQGSEGLGDWLFPSIGNGGYNVKNYDLRLRYATKKPAQSVVGTVIVAAKATESLSRFDLDFGGKSAGTVTVNGKKAGLRRVDQKLRITPAKPILSGTTFTVTVTGFTAKPTKPGKTTASTAFFVTKEGSALAGVPDASHYLYPSNDHPSDKASYTIRLDVPKGETAVANGVLKSKRSTKTRTVWTYAQSQPMASELTQVVVGKYTVVNRAAVGKVKIRDVVPTANLKKFKTSLGLERNDLAWLVKKVGPYPFARYGSLMVNASEPILVETQTLPLYDADEFAYTSDKSRVTPHSYWAPLSVYEQAHQWFGASVSPKAWTDIWLNEGMAIWFELTYAEAHHTLKQDFKSTSLASVMKSFYADGDIERSASGEVAFPYDVSDLYSDNTTTGGSLVLYALRQQIGTAAFDKVIRAWVSTYQGKSASTGDFIALASKVSGQDLSGFLHDWLYTTTMPPMPGHPDWTVTPHPKPAVTSAVGPAPRHGAALSPAHP